SGPARTCANPRGRASSCAVTGESRAALLVRHVDELGTFGSEHESGGAGRPVPVLGDDDLGEGAVVGLRVVDVVAIDEGDDVGVLLQTSRLTEVGEHGALVLAVFELTVEL